MQDFEYQTKRITTPEGAIQTYSFGSGEKIIFAFPSFPHSGLLYLLFTKYYDPSKYKFITLDIPGWAGWSDNTLLPTLNKNGKLELDDYIQLADKVLKVYKVNEFNVIGYSFGGNLALRLALDYSKQVKKVAIVSPILFGELNAGGRHYRLISLTKKLKAYSAFKIRMANRFRELIGEMKDLMGDTVVEWYKSMYDRMHSRSLVECLYTLFTDPGTIFKERINEIPKLLVVSSRDEDPVFRRQAAYLRRLVKSEKKMFLRGSHSDFILHPNSKAVKAVMKFLVTD